MRRLALLLLCAFAVSCGSESPDLAGGSGGGSFPTTVVGANGSVAIEKRPERIVSLSPTGTEMLYAVGAGDQVIAVDALSNYPEEAPETKLSGYEPNAEAIADLEPDLVVLSDDINQIVKALQALKIPTLHQPAATTLDDSYEQLEQLGKATGHVGEAGSVVASMRTKIERLARSAVEQPVTYYHELDQKLFSVTSKTFIGQVYELAGLRNVADAAQGADTGYPQLSAEYIIKADPDLIFLADTKCCGQSAESVSKRPGWDQIAAVRNEAIVELNDDVASRWGPRIVELFEAVVAAVGDLKDAA